MFNARMFLVVCSLFLVPCSLFSADDVWSFLVGPGPNLVSVPERAATTRLLKTSDLQKATGATGVFETEITTDGANKFKPYFQEMTADRPLLKPGAYLLLFRERKLISVSSAITTQPTSAMKLIAFESDRLSTIGIHHLFTMNEDGTNQRALYNGTPAGCHQIEASWSRDGQWVYFANQEVAGDLTKFSICKVKPDGTGFTRVTNRNVDGSFNDSDSPHRFPRVSFDNQYLFYSGYRSVSGNPVESSIYRMKLDTGVVVNLISSPAGSDNGLPIPTPDGQKVLWSSNRTGSYQVWKMNWDGSNQQQMVSKYISALSDISTTAQVLIACNQNQQSTLQLFFIDMNGNNERALTTDTYFQDSGSFSSNGQSAVFYSNVDGNYEIYTIGIDGSSRQRLTNNNYADFNPWYQP